jgi:hypothetical protein
MTRKWLFGGMALIAVLVASAVAIAGDEGPKIDQVEASIVYTFVEGEERICEGPGDEEFVEQRVRVLGTATGSPVLTGDVELSLKLLNENSTGEAFQEGTFVIRDSDTGRKKVVAHFTDAGVAEIFQGTLVGTVKRGAKRLIANWRTTFHPNGAVTAQIGGEAGDGRLPAIVAKGRCKGPFERVEFEIPPPEEDIAARRAAGARVGWLNR